MRINQSDSLVVVYGEKGGIAIALPSKSEALHYRLKNNGADKTLVASKLHSSKFFEAPSKVEFKDLQFSILHPTTILAMTNQQQLYIKDLVEGCQIDKAQRVISLSVALAPKIGLKAQQSAMKQPEFVYFAQSHSQEDLGLCPFNLTLLAADGSLYSLCPVIPNKMILNTNAYESLIDFCRDSHEQQALNCELYQMLESSKVFKEGKYHFNFGKDSKFEPRVVGPFNVSNM